MNDEYQPKARRTNDGDAFELADGGEFAFLDESFSATKLRNLARNSGGTLTITNLSTASTTLSTLGGSVPTVLPNNYTVINLSCTGTMTNGSARMQSATAGRFLMLRWTPAAGGSTASLIIYFSGNAGAISGVRCIGSTGSDVSSISMRQSAASFAKLLLFGESDGVWSILSASGQVTERMA